MSVRRSKPTAATAALALPETLLAEVRGLILEARQQTAQAVNAGLTLLYWQIGARIRREILRTSARSTARRSSGRWPCAWRRSSGAGSARSPCTP